MINTSRCIEISLNALKQWRLEKRSAIWLKVPIMHSKFIAIAAEQGFEFHHAEHQNALLKIWLDESEIDTTPRFATHQVGVSALGIQGKIYCSRPITPAARCMVSSSKTSLARPLGSTILSQRESVQQPSSNASLATSNTSISYLMSQIRS
ncbi:hypothetical protein KUTeg_024739 [Tegillarca granosa]|uniref:Pre-nudix hydrolase domain-containing protein n=1 Tax=Tegillarca granosa TaxID=220873 RepID=A0ABQ9DY83_TEGGR|nr:hypothetical protein KUTeg_024739 [Tegillarca granosa]